MEYDPFASLELESAADQLADAIAGPDRFVAALDWDAARTAYRAANDLPERTARMDGLVLAVVDFADSRLSAAQLEQELDNLLG